MRLVADVHLHSHYSRATSKNLDFEHLAQWAQLKGVNIVGTGDIAHPGWLQEMHDKLEPAEEGLFQLKPEVAKGVQAEVPAACQGSVRFMLAGEISSIYKKSDKVRKIHNVIFAPSLEAVAKIQAALEKIGNIRSDGRPILGLDSRDLLEIILDIDAQNYLIPAHIWTPWFSLLGSKSGFDTIEECFEDLTPHIFALETGLSSDPPMNWRVSMLDGYTLVSNSDAHSPQKLLREANLFDIELSYPAFFEALKTGDPTQFLGTVEFFPEEGKYHYDGHRKCNVRWDPKTTIEHDGLCSVCGKPVTVGVTHRVEELADRAEGEKPARTHPFHSLIPLPEILSEVYGVGPTSKRVKRGYDDLLAKLGSELTILQDVPLEDLERVGSTLLAEGVRRVREGEVSLGAGYDGEFGTLKLFEPHERDALSLQMTMFAPEKPKPPPRKKKTTFEIPADHGAKADAAPSWVQDDLFETALADRQPESEAVLFAGLNAQQQEAVRCINSHLLITAGPGTGKTRTLTHRIAYLIQDHNVPADQILAITFTNKAAQEMAERLTGLLGEGVVDRLTIKTFHAFGAWLLRESGAVLDLDPNFAICSEEDQLAVLKQAAPQLKQRDRQDALEQISLVKNQRLKPGDSEFSDQAFIDIFQAYQTALQENHLLDFDDLIGRTIDLLEQFPDIRQQYQDRFRWVSVDEVQDINLAQYQLLNLLAGPETNVCAIGDPDQAIYGFRGADRRYFQAFASDFPGTRRFELSQNYRSSPFILDASSQVIAQSPGSQRLKLWTEVVDAVKLEIYSAPTAKAEAEYVVHQIEQMMGGTSYFSIDSGRSDNQVKSLSFGDFAVLYRLKAQSHLLVEAFERSGMPFQAIGQTPLTAFKDVKAVLAGLLFLYNGETTLMLEQFISKKRLKQVTSKLTAAREHVGQSISSLIERVREILTEQSLLQVDDESQERLERLVRRAVPFEDRLAEFLESTALEKEIDLVDPRADRVTLMTLHASKGLEFPVVFIVGCEESLLPYQRGEEEPDVDEERRLLYVGMTRAQQQLKLIHAKTRYLFGQQLTNAPARFLNDIEQTLKEISEARYRRAAKQSEEPTQLTLF